MTARRALARLAAAIALVALTAGAMLAFGRIARAADEPVIPAYQGYVTDAAGVLSDDTRAKLEAFLDQLQKKTGAQFAVLTVKSSAPLDPVDFKTAVFQAWKIGEKGKDNGLLLLVSMEEHKIYFETGYGLEGVLPDGLEARIVRERMVPGMRAGDVDAAVTAGVQAAASRIAARAERHAHVGRARAALRRRRRFGEPDPRGPDRIHHLHRDLAGGEGLAGAPAARRLVVARTGRLGWRIRRLWWLWRRRGWWRRRIVWRLWGRIERRRRWRRKLVVSPLAEGAVITRGAANVRPARKENER